jgi:hypothetical protein
MRGYPPDFVLGSTPLFGLFCADEAKRRNFLKELDGHVLLSSCLFFNQSCLLHLISNMTAFGRAAEDRPTPPEVVSLLPKPPDPIRVLICSVQLESLCGIVGHFHGAVDLWLRFCLYWHDHHAEKL